MFLQQRHCCSEGLYKQRGCEACQHNLCWRGLRHTDPLIQCSQHLQQ
jgi:hypothetical protein